MTSPEQPDSKPFWTRVDFIVALLVSLLAVYLIGREFIGKVPVTADAPATVPSTGPAADSAGRFTFHTNEGLRYYFELKDFPKAEAEFRQAITWRPSAAVGHSNLGSALMEQGRVGEALPVLEQAVALDPSLGIARNNLAWARAEQAKANP